MKLSRVWVVFAARPFSTLSDVFGPADLATLGNLYRGGPDPIAVYTDEDEARRHAEAELARVRIHLRVDVRPRSPRLSVGGDRSSPGRTVCGAPLTDRDVTSGAQLLACATSSQFQASVCPDCLEAARRGQARIVDNSADCG